MKVTNILYKKIMFKHCKNINKHSLMILKM